MIRKTDDLDAFVASEGHSLHRLAHVLMRSSSDADDLLQITYLRLIRKWSYVCGAENPIAYARRIMVNEYRALARRRRLQSAEWSDGDGVLDSNLEQIEHREHARSMLSELSPRQRAAIALRYLEDLDYSEIASILGCREATVRSLVKRGLDAIRMAEASQPERTST